MKRDLDLVRFILICAESADGDVTASDIIAFPGCDIRKAAFHVELMRDRGLVEAQVTYAMGREPIVVTVTRLTWEGHDYLDAIRSDKVWRKAKDAIAQAVGDTSLTVVKETCTMVATNLIKQALGN